MKDLLEYITKSILNHPDDIQVTENLHESDPGLIELTLSTHPDDTGLAIGKKGRVARALKNLLQVRSFLDQQRFVLNIRSLTEATKDNPQT